jgi:ATP-dependent Clp protease adaptor protein ClpS
MANAIPAVGVEPDSETSPATPWLVMLGNDPVNTFEYVSHALSTVFGYDPDAATTLTVRTHDEGRCAVWAGARERAEAYAFELHSWGLWATLTEDC